MQIDKHKLTTITTQLMHRHKGILAADESNTSCNKRFAEYNIPGTEENRRRYRELLLATPHIEKYVSGVILYDETIRQMTLDGELFRDLLKQKGILIGIKVDLGLELLEPNSLETRTKGIEDLRSRLFDYKQMNATFTKWRAAFPVSDTLPSEKAIEENCELLARYARVVQETGMIPMVEPEVLLDGNHTIERAKIVTEKVLEKLFQALEKHEVYLGGLILKTSMVVAGSEAEVEVSHELVAKHTAEVLKKNVPPHTGGVVFLSGGQNPQYALHNLNEIAALGPYPWQVTFSFSRALQAPALDAWLGEDSNVGKAQELFIERLELNTLARQAKLEHGKGYISRHHSAGVRGLFWVLVLFIIILLIVL